MKIAHNINLSVFAHEEEDVERIKQALLSLVPFDLEQEKIVFKQTNAQGFKEKKIIIMELTLSKERHTSKFLTFLKEQLTQEQCNHIIKQVDSRLDQEINFFIRLDKQSLLNNDFSITDKGDCFHIKISIAAYPRKRDAALKVVSDWLKQ